MNHAGKQQLILATSGGNIQHLGWFALIGGKSGRDWTRTNDLTDVNPNNKNRVRNVNLLEVESFNN